MVGDKEVEGITNQILFLVIENVFLKHISYK